MRIVPLESGREPLLSPDIVWDAERGVGDLAVSPLSDPVNPGGLTAENAIQTAVIICLMTDRRVEPEELRDGEVNKGWPGDSFDLEPGETALGSRLWQLRRRALDDGIEREAEAYAREALATLIDQGVCVRTDVTASADPARNYLALEVALYGRQGASIFQQRFAVLWDQVDRR
ncbi:phage GP46 family protein [Afifella sp. IM 167]|uniref:phage GP46 family protein n=1 Tax=Afifella sp. IM 167 TaxID=2033586 RepID=UPI001CCFF5F8|nr:phage GP46 family protein [Afifella sp. IM 167]MBZ8133218.1 hypothetical protein [Afifella sp. IM 167]